jgi:serine/threonine-protein kinase
MSPEQARGRDATVRSDLYSAAATLWEARTGRTWLEPKPGESAMELQIRASAARPFKGRITGDPALTAWFAKALHPDPRRRFANARAMREALERALAPSLGAEA